ncbi:hypothetical protein MRX96_040369 [Rhipicephalus microplus]
MLEPPHRGCRRGKKKARRGLKKKPGIRPRYRADRRSEDSARLAGAAGRFITEPRARKDPSASSLRSIRSACAFDERAVRRSYTICAVYSNGKGAEISRISSLPTAPRRSVARREINERLLSTTSWAAPNDGGEALVDSVSAPDREGGGGDERGKVNDCVTY